jgi:hypothetical protein
MTVYTRKGEIAVLRDTPKQASVGPDSGVDHMELAEVHETKRVKPSFTGFIPPSPNTS